jgi:hypothetical protein
MAVICRFFVALFGAALLAGCVTTEPEAPQATPVAADPAVKSAETRHEIKAPAWRVGERWSYSDGYGLEVSAVKDGLTTFRRTDMPDQWLSRYGFFRQDSQGPDAKRSVIFRTVPPQRGLSLDVGQPVVFTREFLTDNQLRVHNTSWVVEGREEITVPAGTFDCWIVVMRTRSLRSNWTGFERWWYSPEVKNYVRMEYKYGDQPEAARVLVSFVTSG